ncbi:MAG TPA: hypothetical protein VHL11_21305, partial [Phototrophicaceae bacterium]|nr:hypothetical protein [Phototrophicaceae bacterium]
MNSRDKILGKLRAAQQPFTDVPSIAERHHMVELSDTTLEALLTRFSQSAGELGCKIYCVGQTEAVQTIKKLIGADPSVLSWSPDYIPLPDLHETLAQADITIAAPDDGGVRVGITGIDAALAATG